MPHERSAPVPPRLRRIQASWDLQKRPPQVGVKWNVTSWRATLPTNADLFDQLPNPIDRQAAMAHATEASNAGRDLEAFITAMVWGYGRVGYGAYRTARVLTESPDAEQKLREVAVRLRRDGGPAAFEWLAGHRLHLLGVAFATKYLFLCGAGSATPALVLDSMIQLWLRKHADWRVRLDWHVADYRRYVQTVATWAAELEISAPDAEYLMFADAIATGQESQWASPMVTTDSTDKATKTAQAENAAVLEALAEAAEAFAALPPGGDPADADDFDYGLRQLRRIVLARTA